MAFTFSAGRALAAGTLLAVSLAGCGSAVPKATSEPPISTKTAPTSDAPSPTSAATTTPPPVSAPAPTTSTTAPAAVPVLVTHDPSGSVTYDSRRPTTIDTSSDSTNIVDRLTWSSWSASGAVGHGQLAANNCQPNCAAGTTTEVPVTITLGGVADGHFTVMTETGKNLSNTYRYPSNWALGAH